MGGKRQKKKGHKIEREGCGLVEGGEVRALHRASV
jgi:hypothetical protein